MDERKESSVPDLMRALEESLADIKAEQLRRDKVDGKLSPTGEAPPRSEN